MEDNKQEMDIDLRLTNQNLAVQCYNNIMEGNGNFKDNLNGVTECSQNIIKMQEIEDDDEKRQVEIRKLEADIARTEFEMNEEKQQAEIDRINKDIEYRDAELRKLEYDMDEELRKYEIMRTKAQCQLTLVEIEQRKAEIKRENFNIVKDILIESGKIIVPIGVAVVTGGFGLGICALKHKQLKDTIYYNSKLQSDGYLGINDQKLVDVSVSDYKSIR